jgi:drug/metabolite transporter (DMT)-like permease
LRALLRVSVPLLNALLVSSGNMLLKWTMTRLGEGAPLSNVLFAPSFWLGLGLYAAGFFVWMALLATSQITRVLPLVVGLTFGCVVAGSIVFFGEVYSPTRMAGVAVIFAGAALISWRQARAREESR